MCSSDLLSCPKSHQPNLAQRNAAQPYDAIHDRKKKSLLLYEPSTARNPGRLTNSYQLQLPARCLAVPRPSPNRICHPPTTITWPWP